ncbi:YggT family protein OS=Streptomyces rimosus subsp. rimosus (strain ATCC / DSM 40260 / JCM 4667/ NRRL 2234) OX=1265868 GN=SRIM_010380 PE=4 SV=1 [Streptomyces rimosus subsp. rimosus]
MSIAGQVIYIALYCFLIVLIFRLVMDYALPVRPFMATRQANGGRSGGHLHCH